MRPNALLCVCMLSHVPAVVTAQSSFTRLETTIVYEGRSTISALPYFGRIENRQHKTRRVAAPPTSMSVLAMEDRLPIASTEMVVSAPETKVFDGLVTPLFVMGMDALSLKWFYEKAAVLATLGARGLVVEAASKSDWLYLKDKAEVVGIDLLLMEGDSLAQGYGIRTYPLLLVGPELAGKGADE